MTAVETGYCQCGCGERVAGRFVRGHHRRTSPVQYVEEDRGFDSPCWVWRGHIDKRGYARTGLGPGKRGSVEAHRAFYVREHGEVAKSMTLDHLCRVRECVNPAHLEPVTNAENCRRGAATKLTWEAVDAIRARLLAGARKCDLAREFNLSRSHVGRIADGVAWAEETR